MLVSGLVSVCWLLCAAADSSVFSVTTKNANVRVPENEGVDLTCSHSLNFGHDPRVEWKFNNMKGSHNYVIYDGKPTDHYTGRVTTFVGGVRFNQVTRMDNGMYECVVSGNGKFGETKVKLTVLVPPSPPVCRIPQSVTTGNMALLSCHDNDGSPPSTYKWYKDDVPLPENPKQFPNFKNASYKLNTVSGNLELPFATKSESGTYYCESSNGVGPPQRCKAVKMEVRDLNTGGIVAGVIVALLLLALLGLGLWYAHKKGYLPKHNESKTKPSVVFQPTSLYGDGSDEDDREFRQKSSFVV